MNIFTCGRVRPALFVLLAALFLLFAGTAGAQTETPPPQEATAEPSPSPTLAPPPADPRFGVIESFEAPAAAARLGVGWTRVRFQWADTQPDSPDDWQPPIDDETLAAELDAGREVVGLLIGIPQWARDRDGLPRGLSLPADDPDNTWAVFVGEVVGRYAGRIDRWIIWNEPDIDDPDAPGHTWDGTIEEFFQLQRAAWLAAKSANPDAAVHLGAFTYFWDPGYFSRYLDVVAADPQAAANNYYFDAATAHLYFQPNAVYNVLYAFRRVMDAHDLEQPIWLVETNAPPMNDPYWEVDNWTLAVTLNEQAAFIPQAIAAAMPAGAERVSVYKLQDTEGDRAANPEPFGLIRWDNSRRPAYDTYRVAIRLMGGATAAERERWDDVGQVRLRQDGRTTTVLFSRLPGPREARIKATADEAELIDMWGKTETIEADDDYFNVELPGALCTQTIADYCMIGGTTYYLIQEDDGLDEAETPAPIAASSPSSRATAVVGATAQSSATLEPSPVASSNAAPRPTDPPNTATVVAVAAPPKSTTEPPPALIEPVESPITETTGPGNYVGLIALGAGVALGAGLGVWWSASRRGGFRRGRFRRGG